MSRRRISRASKLRLSVFGPIFIICIFYSIFSLIYNSYTIYKLSIEKKELEQKYADLQEQAKNLKIDIEKLNDPEYLANYARENYLYSKDGEYIIQIDVDDVNETKEDLNKITLDINKNYIVITLSLIIVVIFIYILRKDRRQKKKR